MRSRRYPRFLDRLLGWRRGDAESEPNKASVSPLLLIGAGRSGTTLFKRIVDAHPEIDFQGETEFLAYRLWREIYENRFWFEWRRSLAANPRDAFFALPELGTREERNLQEHCGTAVQGALKAVLGVRPGSVWGYKEIWNGLNNSDIPWEPYDFIFPRAHWVHLVRHPMAFALSAARWMRNRPDEAYLEKELSDWVRIVKKSRMRRDTGRFHEIRYEDLTKGAHSTLKPILATLGLQWHAACDREAQIQTFVTSKKEQSDAYFTVEMFGTKVPELVELCTELSYSTTLRYQVPIIEEKAFALGYALRTGTAVDYIPLQHFEPRGGLAWFVPLPQLSHLADTPHSPYRSSLIILEDSCEIGPSHALHALIRFEGKGAFSHWHDGIYLSTSDGSDPNLNGRCYFALAPKGNEEKKAVQHQGN